MPPASRGSARCALVPSQWVVLWRNLEQYADPAYFHHHISAQIQADPRNTANTIVLIQESENGTTWTNVAQYDPLVPGGFITISSFHNLRNVRILCFSSADGAIEATRFMPEEQALPDIDEAALSCLSFCEQSCETGTETTGEWA